MKNKLLYLLCLVFFLTNFFCTTTNRKKYLSTYNEPSKAPWNALPKQARVGSNAQQYCFRIMHDAGIDLSDYFLIIAIDGMYVYSDRFKPSVVASFEKKGPHHTFAILLLDSLRYVYSRTNKEVYDFEDTAPNCYRITLYSDKNKDYSNGYHMKVY